MKDVASRAALELQHGERSTIMEDAVIETHPIQWTHTPHRVPKAVTMLAYEVYSHVFAPQAALVTGGCRGGFGAGELIAFLYARAFPKEEWDKRFHEALRGADYRTLKPQSANAEESQPYERKLKRAPTEKETDESIY